jgi:hypothetical protein
MKIEVERWVGDTSETWLYEVDDNSSYNDICAKVHDSVMEDISWEWRYKGVRFIEVKFYDKSLKDDSFREDAYFESIAFVVDEKISDNDLLDKIREEADTVEDWKDYLWFELDNEEYLENYIKWIK